VSRGGKVFAFSGDTEWTDALTGLARVADLFLVECHSGEARITGHLDWPTLHARLPQLAARKIMVTHLGATALPRRSDFEAAGVLVAEDGLVLDL
jgi:ribonuclease BN (tRNA processing enzyme)